MYSTINPMMPALSSTGVIIDFMAAPFGPTAPTVLGLSAILSKGM